MMLESNSWKTMERIRVIFGNRKSTIRGTYGQFGTEQVQQKSYETLIPTEQMASSEQDKTLSQWQEFITKQILNLFRREGKVRNYKVQAEFWKLDSGETKRKKGACNATAKSRRQNCKII